MNPYYAAVWQSLRVVSSLEKTAGSQDVALVREGQLTLAEACDALFSRVKAASIYNVPAGLRGKEAAAAGMACFMLSARDTHAAVGEKLASSLEETADLLHKLAAAVYVDEVLSEELQKLSGEEAQEAREVQLLGREFAVNLMGGLLR